MVNKNIQKHDFENDGPIGPDYNLDELRDNGVVFISPGVYARVEDTIVLGNNQTVSTNNTVYIDNLAVSNSLEVPTREGDVKYDNETKEIMVFINDDWQDYNLNQKPKSRWERFKSWVLGR